MAISFKINMFGVLHNFDLNQILPDWFSTFIRVSISALFAWILGIFFGYLFYKFSLIENLGIDSVNFIRNISPFALLPFAIIWFGLGELPLLFIMFVTLFFPSLIASSDIFRSIDKSYIEEASVLGCGYISTFIQVELPLVFYQLVNQFRIIWALGWATIIAAEMLGVKNGLGSRLLDFRYLLEYSHMIQYLLIMGLTGIGVDRFLVKLAAKFKLE